MWIGEVIDYGFAWGENEDDQTSHCGAQELGYRSWRIENYHDGQAAFQGIEASGRPVLIEEVHVADRFAFLEHEREGFGGSILCWELLAE